ncbi:MAG: hypothetical protein HY043_11030 [Verrucomicrobia bacterium]|nr:hypothetical protein [Verrucomicrobiota bacterium]
MSSLRRWRAKPIFLCLLAGLPSLVGGQSLYSPQAGQYAVAGSLPGDQVHSDVSVNGAGGYVVWQDHFTDGDGLGISAQRLDATFSGTLNTFRVNEQGKGDQENPRVAMLKNGGAAFVWQGGRYGFQRIYARFLNKDGTFATGDVMVNTYVSGQQIDPSLAALSDGNIIVTWSSFGQDGSLYGVYAQRLAPDGSKLGSEFQVNQTTRLNQRASSVAALAGGGFVVTWVSERLAGVVHNTDDQGRTTPVGSGAEIYAVDVFARIYDASGVAQGAEFKASSRPNLCANPTVSGVGDGGFAVAWSERVGKITVDGEVKTNGWDIATRVFDAQGTAKGDAVFVNTYTYGDQFLPRLAGQGNDLLLVWTSLGQDGSREGVFGRFLAASGSPTGDEFLVNTTTISQQLHPATAADGAGRFLVVWSSFVGGPASFDLFSQRYASAGQPVVPPAAPMVSALSQSRLSVAWPELAGYDVERYELQIDGNNTPILIAENHYVLDGLAATTSHSFRLAVRLKDGRTSPLSAAVNAKTWGEDANFDGLPDDWQARYWGADAAKWPVPGADTDGDGASNLQEFLAGTDPTNAQSVLRTRIINSDHGPRLEWNSEPGVMVQVQTSTDFKNWKEVGTPRFSAGKSDSIPVTGKAETSFYRIIRIR